MTVSCIAGGRCLKSDTVRTWFKPGDRTYQFLTVHFFALMPDEYSVSSVVVTGKEWEAIQMCAFLCNALTVLIKNNELNPIYKAFHRIRFCKNEPNCR